MEPLSRQRDKARLMAQVDVQEDTGCWHQIAERMDGIPIARRAWMLFKGGIPDDAAVRRHPKKCPTAPIKGVQRLREGSGPKCCNPDHLRLMPLTEKQLAHRAKLKEWAEIDRREREEYGF